jgi:hypothetical protein
MKFSWLSKRVARLPVWGWAVVVLVIATIGASASPSPQSSEEESVEVSTVVPTTKDLPSTTSKPPATTSTQPAITTTTLPVIGPGTYIVGRDIQPGGYRVSGYFARLDTNMDIIDNDGVYNKTGLTYVVVEPSDAYLELSGETIAIEDFPVYDPLIAGATEGTYLVNVDIQPGRYRIVNTNYAYAARLSCNRDIIDNAGNTGNVIIIIKASDCLFSFSGVLTRID